MALKVDPNQKGITVALIVILVAAIGITVFRVMPGSVGTQSAPQQEQASVQIVKTNSNIDADFEMTRNPFTRPSTVIETNKMNSSPQAEVMITSRAGKLSDGKIQPMNIRPIPGFTANMNANTKQNTSDINQNKPSTQKDKNKPSYTLLATIEGNNGSSAVIRNAESKVIVVKVGDIIDGRYKIKSLDNEQVVLVNGEDMIIAKRPQS